MNTSSWVMLLVLTVVGLLVIGVVSSCETEEEEIGALELVQLPSSQAWGSRYDMPTVKSCAFFGNSHIRIPCDSVRDYCVHEGFEEPLSYECYNDPVTRMPLYVLEVCCVRVKQDVSQYTVVVNLDAFFELGCQDDVLLCNAGGEERFCNKLKFGDFNSDLRLPYEDTSNWIVQGKTCIHDYIYEYVSYHSDEGWLKTVTCVREK